MKGGQFINHVRSIGKEQLFMFSEGGLEDLEI
jgi:hypothetical protein